MSEQSSFIANATYDPTSQELNVWMHDGRQYRGQGVSLDDGNEMLRSLQDPSLSAGQTFNQRIKQNYQLELVQDTSTTTSTDGSTSISS